MDPLTIIVAVVVIFILFLMLTSGHHRHRLQQALNSLETERIRLMKSIEHVKLSFYRKQIDEKQAQDKIFGYEEQLRDVEGKILGIREKPLMRTLQKQEAEKAEDAEVSEEKEEVVKSERMLLANFGARTIAILFIVIITVTIGVVILTGRAGPAGVGAPVGSAQISLPMIVTTTGTYPGSAASVRVDIQNPGPDAVKGVMVIVRSPEGSGVHFQEGELSVKQIAELEAGGTRELFFYAVVDSTASEGEYVIGAEADVNGKAVSTASGKLIVRIGKGEGE